MIRDHRNDSSTMGFQQDLLISLFIVRKRPHSASGYKQLLVRFVVCMYLVRGSLTASPTVAIVSVWPLNYRIDTTINDRRLIVSVSPSTRSALATLHPS